MLLAYDLGGPSQVRSHHRLVFSTSRPHFARQNARRVHRLQCAIFFIEIVRSAASAVYCFEFAASWAKLRAGGETCHRQNHELLHLHTQPS